MTDPRTYAQSLRDINDDGVPDLIMNFSADSAGIDEKVERVCVRAKMRGGERIIGCSALERGAEPVLMRKLEYVQSGNSKQDVHNL